MSNGQLIHLEIDSGCGVPHKPGKALGNWSRARSWPEIGQAAEELGYAGFRCAGSAPCGAWGSRGASVSIAQAFLKPGAALIIFIYCLPRIPFLLVSLGLIHSWRGIPQCPGVQFIPPCSLPLSPRFTLLVSGLALLCLLLCLPPVLQMGGFPEPFPLARPAPFHPSGVSSHVTSWARGLS